MQIWVPPTEDGNLRLCQAVEQIRSAIWSCSISILCFLASIAQRFYGVSSVEPHVRSWTIIIHLWCFAVQGSCRKVAIWHFYSFLWISSNAGEHLLTRGRSSCFPYFFPTFGQNLGYQWTHKSFGGLDNFDSTSQDDLTASSRLCVEESPFPNGEQRLPFAQEFGVLLWWGLFTRRSPWISIDVDNVDRTPPVRQLAQQLQWLRSVFGKNVDKAQAYSAWRCWFFASVQGGAPQVISWFITPLTIDISTINHSYWSYKPT